MNGSSRSKLRSGLLQNSGGDSSTVPPADRCTHPGGSWVRLALAVRERLGPQQYPGTAYWARAQKL
jgi:hypothetical protein